MKKIKIQTINIILAIGLLLLTLSGCSGGISLPACPQPEVYFCPEGQCKEAVMEELDKAEESIYFMLYSFTDPDIGDLLVKKHDEGIYLEGIVEKQQASSKYSQYHKLEQKGVHILIDKNKALMHHKVWIIDGKTVITGSYNPTRNGNLRNNENAIILRDLRIAHKFQAEFSKLFDRWS